MNCVRCNINEPEFICEHCGENKLFCKPCDAQLHSQSRNGLHSRHFLRNNKSIKKSAPQISSEESKTNSNPLRTIDNINTISLDGQSTFNDSVTFRK
jgi:hypothetical protein